MRLIINLAVLLLVCGNSISQDTIILKAPLFSDIRVYKDSIGIEQIGEIKKDESVFLLAPRGDGFLVYRSGITGYSSKNNIDINKYVARTLTYGNLDWKYKRVKEMESGFDKNIKLVREIDSLQKIHDSLLIISKAQKDFLKNSKNTLNISSFSFSSSDYSAGFSIQLDNYKRNSKIKYSYITITAFNPVNDIEATKTFTCIGPVAYLSSGRYNFDNAFFSKVITKLRLTKIIIEYMDGTKRAFEGALLKDIQNYDEED
jgi:hypothetical protein